MTVRVRIGPSPTGEPHVGTAYIALFNLAYAKQNGGKFVLRIEDTDRVRSKIEWEQEIIQGLRWLGLDWDEGPDVGGPFGPYRQSERGPIYTEHADILLAKGHAYRCFCTKERLDAVNKEKQEKKLPRGYDRHCRDLPDAEIKRLMDEKTPFVVRMKMPIEGSATVPDQLRGDISIDYTQVDDQVILKSDGFPTYHLANVVDDHLMGITDVIRAEEWISSTPKHVLLYEMFGWEKPRFFHMPLLRNPDKNKSKISKRKNPVSLLDYKSRGLLPAAVLNYLAMLGWTMPDGREVFSFDEFSESFTWERLNLGGPVFDIEKLTWLNGKYFREKLNDDELASFLRESLFSQDHIRALVPLVKERIDSAEQFVPYAPYFFAGSIEPNLDDAKPKKRTFKELKDMLEKFAEVLDKQVDFSAGALEELSVKFAEDYGWTKREAFAPVRVLLTASNKTPPLFDTMSQLGRARVRRRLREGIVAVTAKVKEEAKG